MHSSPCPHLLILIWTKKQTQELLISLHSAERFAATALAGPIGHVVPIFTYKQLAAQENGGGFLLALQTASHKMRSYQTSMPPLHSFWDRRLQLRQTTTQMEEAAKQEYARDDTAKPISAQIPQRYVVGNERKESSGLFQRPIVATFLNGSRTHTAPGGSGSTISTGTPSVVRVR
ncbi:hypothetical protein DPSP01_010897 [Paraphaeosphaeria sporulosa]